MQGGWLTVLGLVNIVDSVGFKVVGAVSKGILLSGVLSLAG